MWCSLVGREGRSATAGRLIGLRNNGIKYIRSLENGSEVLFDVERDAAESKSLVEEQLEVLELARRLVSSEATALEVRLRETESMALGTRMMLEALGYTQ
jgi:hypothetical protein